MTIRVVLAEDNYLLRAGTAALLGALDGVELVAATADKDELLTAVEEHRPDVVITDIRMPPDHQTEGLAAAATIRTKYPGTGVILLTQFADPQYAYEFLRHGAAGAGYLLKERIGDITELERSLHQVAAGGSALDPQLVEALVVRKERAAGSPLGMLTPVSGRYSSRWPRARTTRPLPRRLSSPNVPCRSTSTPCSASSASATAPTPTGAWPPC